MEEHVQPALDARPRLAPLRDVDVPEGLHARVVRRVTGEKLVLDGRIDASVISPDSIETYEASNLTMNLYK